MYEVKVINKSPKEYEKIAESLSRYIKFVLFENSNTERGEDQILLLPVDEKIWNDNKIGEASNENSAVFDDIKGILFFTTEELARGDTPESYYNKSRMIRSFFERSTYSKTANHSDVFIKIRELLLEIEFGKTKEYISKAEDISKAFKQLDELKNKIGDLIKKDFCKSGNITKPGKCNSYWEKMQRLYTYRNFHTYASHAFTREIEKYLIKRDRRNFFKKSLNLRFEELLYDLAFTVAWNPLRLKKDPPKILIIDDNPKGIFKKWKDLLELLPESTDVYITTRKSWKEFEKKDFWSKLYQYPSNKNDTNCKIDLVKIVKKNKQFNESNNKTYFLIKNNKFEFTNIVIDLLFENYNEGNRIIREFVRFRHKLSREKEIDAKFDIIALSLSEEIEDIHRSLQEGAVTFVSKRRIYSLPGVIARLEEGRKNLPGQKSVIAKYRNFGKLYNLPEEMKRKLCTEPFAEFVDKGENKKYLNKLSKYLANDWIKIIPKAELHFHIGGSMNGDIVFNLALNSLWRKNKNWIAAESQQNSISRKFELFINIFLDTITPIMKNFKNEEGKEHLIFSDEKKKFEEIIFEEIKLNTISENSDNNSFDKEYENIIIDTSPKKIKKEFLHSVKLWIADKDYSKIKSDKKLFLMSELLSISEPKKWDLEISEITDEKLVFQYITWVINKELSNEIKSDEIKEDDVICLFIVLIGKLEGRDDKSIEKFWELINILSENLKNDNFQEIKDRLSKSRENGLNKFFKEIINKFNNNALKDVELRNFLHNLISAEKRKGSLKNYLKGSIFCGSLHLQYYENIFACVAHLIKEAADDNIRYLEIRVSPEGYTKEHLTTQEAIQAIFDGADLMSHYLYKEEKFIWVNFIITAKRHKTPEKMAIEISSAITNRERTIGKKEKLKEIQKKLPKNKLTILGYEWQPSRIVGVDLAGLEKGYNPAQYVEDFAPLFKTCSFLTIHAGEEGSAQNIWEAVYKLNAHRIGHGLTLIKHQFLLELAKNTQICIEMAPISNIFTNPNLENNYPLYDYIKKGICVTINTDDKAWSDSTLSDEYVKGAELYWKRAKNKNLESEFKSKFLTKWEVLRIVKNGFKKAFIDREEKRDLLKAVEEEIYQLVLLFNRVEKEKFYL